MLISGSMLLDGFSSFIANEGGGGGLAIESFGELENGLEDFGMMFVDNTFRCPVGQYSFDADIHVSQVLELLQAKNERDDYKLCVRTIRGRWRAHRVDPSTKHFLQDLRNRFVLSIIPARWAIFPRTVSSRLSLHS